MTEDAPPYDAGWDPWGIPVVRPRVTEMAFQQVILDAARALGWSAYHTHDSRRSASGFPDLVLVRPPQLVFFEVKTEKGRVSPWQQWWIDQLARVPGIVARVVRPDDWSLIETILMGEG